MSSSVSSEIGSESEAVADVVDITTGRKLDQNINVSTEVDTDVVDLDMPDFRFYSRADITRILGISPLETKKLTDPLITALEDSFFILEDDDSGTLVCEYEMFNEVSKEVVAPKGWVTPDEVVCQTGFDRNRVRKLMTNIGDITNPEQIRLHKVVNKEESYPALHMSSEVAHQVISTLMEIPPNGRTEEEKRTEGFEVLTEDVRAGLSPESKKYKALLTMFGPEIATDLFYRMFPDARTVPVGDVKSFLADYLGEFIVDRGKLNFEYLNEHLELLSDVTFRDLLVEAIKKDCLDFYHSSHRESPGEDEIDVILTYLYDLRDKLKTENQELLEVVDEVEKFYFSLFDDYNSPDGVVGSLRGDRPFPDLNQRINIKEICEKRRMLIADDPGMGKSASAILAKEHLGLKTAVIIAPSSVIDKKLWQTYLSDTVGPDGTPIGYFEQGRSPSVLVVDNPDALKGVNYGDYEYVIMSQEKLSESYPEDLKRMGFDMLIVDEAHKLKNMTDGVRANALVGLSDELTSKENSCTVLLTATPTPNKVSDIAMAMRLMYPEKFSDISNKELAYMMINGDVRELRSFLIPRMQMKRIEDSVDIPEIDETIDRIEISEQEADLLRLYIEDDELDFSTKLQICRKILLNPATVDVYPKIIPSKAVWLNEKLQKAFNDEGDTKVVVFVNDFKQEVLTGESTLADFIDLPSDVRLEWIHGDVDKGQKRYEIQQDFQNGHDRMLLIVNGMVADVGVDFSAADTVIIQNVGWTESEKRQEIGRAHRPGRTKPLKVRSSIAEGTVESAMYSYAKRKEKAIRNLLVGVPLSEMDQELLRVAEDEKVEAGAAEVEPELGTYYFSALQSLNRILARTKQQGEQATRRMVDRDGEKYASIYQDLTGRSYQANMARLSGSIVEGLISEGTNPSMKRKIIDLGSGPEMLRRHISDELAPEIISLDINQHHFTDESNKAVVGSVVSLPIASKSADIVTMGLVLGGTKFLPSKRSSDPESLERLEILKEINRVLKPNGHAVITLVYSLDLKSEMEFNKLAKSMGLKVISHYSGQVSSETNDPRGRVITLQKTEDCPTDIDELALKIGTKDLQGLKFSKKKARVKDPKKIDRAYKISRKNRIVPVFNQGDREIADEEAELLARMEHMKNLYGGIVNVPEDVILAGGLSRVNNNGQYVLFRRLASANGAVFLKDKKR